MDESDNLIIKCVTAFFITLVLSISGCVSYTNKRIADSEDPLAVACATAMSQSACIVAQR